MNTLTASRSRYVLIDKLKWVLIFGLLPILLVLIYTFFSIVEPQFNSRANLFNILNQASYLAMLATAQLMVLLTRGFDLSVGNVISMISVGTSVGMVSVFRGDPGALGWAIAYGWVLAFAMGAATGFLNGLAVAYLKVSPFITTLGMMTVAEGFASTLSGGRPVYDVPERLMDLFSRGDILGVPVPVVVCLAVLAGVYVLLYWTKFGRSLFIIGSNERAAWVAGIPVKRNLVLTYVVCSLITGIVAFMLTARTGSGEPRLGGGLMLDSLMAAIIGGVSLRGGDGRILYCIVGALFVTMLGNGMNMIRVDSYIQMMILGVALITAVFIDGFRARIW